MPNTPDTEATFKPFEGKVPKTANLPNEDTTNQWQARAQNIETNNILNAGITSMVSVPTAQQQARAVDPLLLSKILQHKASFANNYIVDSVVTTSPPSDVKHIIKLISVEGGLEAKHIIINERTPTPSQTIPYEAEVRSIADSVDAQPFDSLPNGAEFNFVITENNTLQAIDIAYEFKHLVYNQTDAEQQSETKTLTYPLKDINGNADIGVNILTQNSRATIVFDKELQVFKLMSVSNSSDEGQQEHLFQAVYTPAVVTPTPVNEIYTLNQSSDYTLPSVVSDGFVAQFVAPENNTGSATVRIQKYDGTYHTALTLKKYEGTNLVNLVENDLEQNQLYTIVIIGGEAVVFGIDIQNQIKTNTTNITASLQAQQRIIFSYNSPTVVNYSAGGFVFDDYSGSAVTTAGTLNLTGLTANASWYIFGIYNPTTGVSQVAHYNTLTPTPPAGFTKKKLLFAFVTNASSQVRPFTMYADGYIEYVTPILQTRIALTRAQDFNGLYSLTVPMGIINLVKAHSISSDKKAIFIGSAPQTTVITNGLQANHAHGETPDSSFALFSSASIEARTNTNSQISISTAFLYQQVPTTIRLTTHGYTIIS